VRQWREGGSGRGRVERASADVFPPFPLGRSVFLFPCVCVYGYLSYEMEGYVPSFQTSGLHFFPVIPTHVKFPYAIQTRPKE